jgi:hypothetical protein
MLTSWVDLAVGELNTGRVTARQDDLPNQGVATNPAESGGPVRARNSPGRCVRLQVGTRVVVGATPPVWVSGEFWHGRGWFELGLVAPATTSPPRNAT